MRRSRFDLQYIYWGGQELGAEDWWKQVEKRREEAKIAMAKAEDLWFKKFYGGFFRRNKLENVLSDVTSGLIGDWMMLLEFYLTAIIGSNVFHKLHKTDRSLMGTGKDAHDIPRGDILTWYQIDPQVFLLENLVDSLSLIALAINAGYYSKRQVALALSRLKKGECGVKWGSSDDEFLFIGRDLELSGLENELHSEDPKKKIRAESILGIQNSQAVINQRIEPKPTS